MNTRPSDSSGLQRILNADEFRALKALDSCAVANAIERFQVQLRNEGYTEGWSDLPFSRNAARPRICHDAQSAFRGAAHAREKPFWKIRNGGTLFWPFPSPRILVIQDMDRIPGVGALVGEVHAAILKSLDCVGVVTNGAVRDLHRIQQLGFQMFSGKVSVSHAYSHIVRVGGPVQIGGLEISPGDLLHGDRHGIVRVPKELASRIPATATALASKR